MNSKSIFDRSQKIIPGGVNSPVRAFRNVGGTPFVTRSAEGAVLTTLEGDKLIDFVMTWGPAIHGHNHPKIREAIREAMESGTSFGTPNPYELPMAEKLLEMVPSLEMVRMVNSGTEATMSSIRLARGFTGRNKVIKFSGCYHGHVDGLLVKAGSGALTLGYPDSAGVPEGYARETLVLPYNDTEALEKAFSSHGGELAAVIVEPFPANCGLILPRENFLQSLRRLCTDSGAVLIFDEVMTGFRLARGGVQELTGVIPDLTALGKIIGGGLPVGAFGGRRDIMECLAPVGPVYQAGTLSGNPLAMAAGLKSISLLDENPPYADLQYAGETLKKAILEAAGEKGIPLQVPQVGSMFCIFFSESPVHNAEEAAATRTDLFKPLFHNALKHGVYLPPSPFETCFISTAHLPEAIEMAAEVLGQSIREI